MSDRPTVLRSQLGRARGLGAAHAGVEHWWGQRVSSVALAPLSLWFVISVLSLVGAAWVARPLNAALLLALILLTFHHAQAGMQVVFEDYIHGARLRMAIVLVTRGAALLLGLLGALSVAKLYLAH
jgi:succinate dehydrogenase / fumarate reductase membrane anchor subunit